MTSFFVTFGQEVDSSGLGALGLNGKAFLIQLITFVIVFLILRRYAFKPILKILARRRELIDSGVTLGEEMNRAKAALDDKVAKALQDARSQADDIMGTAQENARELAREAETNARAKADTILAGAKVRIDQETARARTKLEKELVGLVAEATEAIIDEKVDDKKDARLIDRALKGQKA